MIHRCKATRGFELVFLVLRRTGLWNSRVANWNLYLAVRVCNWSQEDIDMSKLLFRTLIIALASALMAFGAAGAANARPHGFSMGKKVGWHHGHVPPGWSHGRKVGWHGAGHPPGLR